LFDTADTVRATVRVLAAMLPHTRVNAAACRAAVGDPALLATDLADYLVRKGAPFREAHHVVGTVMALAERQQQPVNLWTLAELRRVDKRFGADALAVFHLETALAKRNSTGAPGTKSVRQQLARWRKILADNR
jgi:argininosuccinate lyase